MPTPLPGADKAAFISLVQAAPRPGGPEEAARLQDILNDYEDIYTAICRQLDLFASNNPYLTQAIACFNTDAALQAVGIWNNKTAGSPPLMDPKMIINSDYTGDWVLLTQMLGSPPTPMQGLVVLGSTKITRIVVEGDVGLANLYLGPGVEVDVLDASASGAYVNELWMPFIKSLGSKLNKAIPDSLINITHIDEGSYFGGYSNDDPQNTCASPVTNLVTGAVTHNTVPLTWTPPAGAYLFINVYFKKQGENTWIQATEDEGDFDGVTGFTFTKLAQDTYYDFSVRVVCNNGGVSDSVELSIQTSCCD